MLHTGYHLRELSMPEFPVPELPVPELPTLKLIDTHCHLDIAEFDPVRGALIKQCEDNGMQGIIVPGITCATWLHMLEVCASHRLLHPALGLHPCFMPEHQRDQIAQLDALIQPGIIAVGEIGLDTFHSEQDFSEQRSLFSAQVAVAKNHRLPLIIHARKTHDQILKVLRSQAFGFGGAVHAFSGSLQQAQQFVELGFVIGFGGGATYDRANKLRTILKTLQPEGIVLETDSPDIAPSFARGEVNTPFNLFRITEILASVLDVPAAELAQRATANANRVFRLY